MISPEWLRRFSLFAGLDLAVLKEIAMAGEQIAIHEGDRLFSEHDQADALYLIVSGNIELIISRPQRAAVT